MTSGLGLLGPHPLSEITRTKYVPRGADAVNVVAVEPVSSTATFDSPAAVPASRR